MLKKVTQIAQNVAGTVKKSVLAVAAAAVAVVSNASASFAATPATATSNNADLDTAANSLIGGIGDMKTDGLVIVGVCIVVFVCFFGISWLIRIVRKKMSSAS